MAKSQAEMTVRRGRRLEGRLAVVVDVRDQTELQTELVNWLTINRWPARHWGDFTAEFRTGEGRPVIVRAAV